MIATEDIGDQLHGTFNPSFNQMSMKTLNLGDNSDLTLYKIDQSSEEEKSGILAPRYEEQASSQLIKIEEEVEAAQDAPLAEKRNVENISITVTPHMEKVRAVPIKSANSSFSTAGSRPPQSKVNYSSLIEISCENNQATASNSILVQTNSNRLATDYEEKLMGTSVQSANEPHFGGQHQHI